MKIKFNVSKEERKALARALGEVTGAKAVYGFAPTFAFTVGDYVIDRAGTLICEGEAAKALPTLLDALAARGFVHEEPEIEEIAPEPEISRDTEPAPEAFEPDDSEAILGLDLAEAGIGDAGFRNLVALANSKTRLIRKALGEEDSGCLETLPVLREGGMLRFQWFWTDWTQEERSAWLVFVAALRETARKQKRVVPRDTESGLSDREAFRCFLLRLGFIGGEYAAARKVLLSRLSAEKPKRELTMSEEARGNE